MIENEMRGILGCIPPIIRRGGLGVRRTPHDLRRTATSMMTSLKIAELDVSKVLNHTIQTVTNKHYNHYSYDKEKQKALGVWDRKLTAILTGKSSGKVISLKR